MNLKRFNDWSYLVLFLALSFPLLLVAQPTIQDCLGAIPVCQDFYSESQSPSGSGSIQNEIPNGQTCTDGESNSIWYVFTASQNGFLGFIITPNNLNDDYDWALFDLTNGNCSNLNANTLVSCNAAGGSGCHGRTGCSASGVSNWVPGGCGGSGPINSLVPMQAGNTYVLMVSNWTGSNSGYTLDFSESTGLGVFDETPPLVESVTNLPQSCGDQTMQVTFNELIQCTSLANSAFQLAGPGGPYTLTASASACSSGGEQTSSLTLQINPPIQALGDYTLSIVPVAPTDLLDLCDNQTEDYVFNFSVGIPLPIAIDIGQDTSLVCVGDQLVLDASAAGTGFLWEDGSTNPTLTVSNAGIYRVTVTDACGVGEDAVEVFVQQQPPTVNFGPDQLLCSGDDIRLNADNGLAFYQWQNNTTQPTLLVNTTGDYAVTVTNGCGVVEEAINITFVPALNLNLATEYVLCLDDTLKIDVERPFASYQWADGSVAPQKNITADGSFAVTVTTLCERYEAAFNSIFLVDPVLDFGKDLVLCPNDTLVLSPGIPGAAYQWQDGSTANDYRVTTPGTYQVTVTTACNVLADAVVIDYLLPITTNLGRDTFLCAEEPYLLDAGTEVTADYEWENGDQVARRLVFGPGAYSVTVTSVCETVIDTLQIAVCEICKVYMPNVFSPNEDGVNDRLVAQSPCGLDAFSLEIYDRWGNQLYQSNNPADGWNGKVKGRPAPEGAYVWMIGYTVTENGYPRRAQQRGEVVIIR
ncbi:MAG: hypothetical protein DA408_18875 [Bacteroidetes bacterium]|nr:MAG: hypothetical protein C7N36_08965 [Bacteroidota bacterium]PTM09226.1 MAG: hypothetical protein DA408_18875 [Bacteroidota bacterium]